MSLTNFQHPIVITGINHKTASVEIRERCAISSERTGFFLNELIHNTPAREAMLVSTCNRMEVISVADGEDLHGMIGSIKRLIEKNIGVRQNYLNSHMYDYLGRSAVSHLFKVASGLDSMIIGEPEILGQIKRAYERAKNAGTIDFHLKHLMPKAFEAAKLIRSHTMLGHHPVSFCYAARDIAEKIFGNLSDVRVLIVGAGKMAALVGRHLKSAGVEKLFIANSTSIRAEELAKELDAFPMSLSSVKKILPQIDIAIGACHLEASSSPLISIDNFPSSNPKNSMGRYLFIDLSVPRNFSEDIVFLSNVFYYNIDQLGEIIHSHLQKRHIEAERALEILETEVSRYLDWLNMRKSHLTLREMFNAQDELANIEMCRAKTEINRLQIDEKSKVEICEIFQRLSKSISRKSLHNPAKYLRQSGGSEKLVELYRQIFLDF